MDQGSGDGWFFERIEILAISLWKIFPKFENKIIQNSLFQMVSLEEQRAKKRTVSTRKTDRLHDL